MSTDDIVEAEIVEDTPTEEELDTEGAPTINSTEMRAGEAPTFEVIKGFLAPIVPPDVMPLAPARGETVTSFFTMEGLDGGLVTSQYTSSEEVGLLVEICRNRDRPDLQMAAMKMLHDRMREALIMSGGIQEGKVTRVQTLGDTTLTAELSGQRLRGSAHTDRMLENATQTVKVLTQGDPNESSETSSIQQEPERDLGGGGICRSSREKALASRAAAHASRRNGGNGPSFNDDPFSGLGGPSSASNAADGLPDPSSDE